DTGMPKDISGTVVRLGQFFDDLDIVQPHVAGNSLGGAIALELAAAGVVASATAFSPAGFFTEPERRRALCTLSVMRASTFQPRFVLKMGLQSAFVRARS